MSNIKPNYLIPGLGMAVIWNDFTSALNRKEEKTLLIYHLVVTGVLIGGVIALWILR
jgi:hypothetical protein